MRVIIAGSRDLNKIAYVYKAVIKAGFGISEVVSGTARGIDTLGEEYAKRKGIPIEPFPANWYPKGIYDNSAGYKRNKQMAQYADALIAIWDGKSKGTGSMIDLALKNKLFVYIYYIK